MLSPSFLKIQKNLLVIIIISSNVGGYVQEDHNDLGLLLIGGEDGGYNRTTDFVTCKTQHSRYTINRSFDWNLDNGECFRHSFPALPYGRVGGVAGML